jgi:hypothetical protein
MVLGVVPLAGEALSQAESELAVQFKVPLLLLVMFTFCATGFPVVDPKKLRALGAAAIVAGGGGE